MYSLSSKTNILFLISDWINAWIKSSLWVVTHPIVTIKQQTSPITGNSYERAHISFQSILLYNFSTVKALNSCKFYIRSRERGRSHNKWDWVIEVNDTRSWYLSSYGTIDNVNNLVKFCSMKLCSWKFWHATMLHVKALTCTIAYNIYYKCIEGNLNPTWKIDNPLISWQFRDKLG